jgi:tetratricopeptide (TPR) repeat protein
MATAAVKTEVRQPTESGLFSSPAKRRLIIALGLALLALLLYNPATQYGFVNFDDPAYVTGNRSIQAGLSWQTVIWAFRSTEQANWHPLTWLSHALDYQLFHLRASGHHYSNVLLHAACVILLFLFLESATGLAGRSAVVAALFAVHPINVESVAWISERKNILCTLFFLLGLWLYQWYARNPDWKRYLAVAFSFALALMSKPMAITFPCLLLVLDYWPLGRMPGLRRNDPTQASTYPTTPLVWLVLEKVPLLLLSTADGIITMIAQKAGGALRTQYPLSLRAENALVSYARYIAKAFWPTHLAALYPFPRNGVPVLEIVLASLVVLSISAAVLLGSRKRYLAAGWFWFLGTLVPMIGLVQVGEQAMADRYAYIAFMGLFIVLVWGVADWAASHRISQQYLGLASLLAVGALGVVTRTQMKYWVNATTLWSHTLAVTPPNFVAEDNLGAELIGQGDIPAARAHFQRASEINPQDAFSEIDIGVCDKQMGNVKGAMAHYEAALRLSSEPTLRSTAYNNLGSLYRMAHNYPAARENYTAALRINPEIATTLIGLGIIAQRTGDAADAANYFSRAVATQPSDVAYVFLSRALDAAGRKPESAAALEQAKKITADLDVAQKEADRLLSE